jgi:hypothetical protein
LAPLALLHHVTGSNSAVKSISNPPATHVNGSLMVLMAEIPIPSVPSGSVGPRRTGVALRAGRSVGSGRAGVAFGP